MRQTITTNTGAWLGLVLSVALTSCSGGEEGESSSEGTGGFAASSGGTSATGLATGGSTGTPAGVGGSSATTGGAAGNTGGATGNTGGSSATTGGAAGNTGGATGNTGGSSATTGGSSATTGGATGNTGGSSATTGGSSATTGGAAGNTGGTTDDTGGAGSVTAGDFTVSAQLASDVDPQAPGTVGIVQWSLAGDTVVEAHIEFGLDTSYAMSAPVDLAESGFRTLLLGMKPNSDYHFRIVASTATGTFYSVDQELSTGPVTNLVTLGGFDVINEAARERGFIISEYFQSGMGTGQSGSIAFIIDPDGEIVWWYQSPTLTSLARARMSADGKNMWLTASGLNGAALERVTMDTLESQLYDVVASHDLTPVTGSKMAYLEYGESDCDSIVEIDPNGTPVEVFESADVSSSQCHSNALRYSAAEDVYTFSDHRLDVYVVDRSGQVSWSLTDRVGPNSTWGGAQHGHHLLDNSILIFANDGGTGGAAVIEYDLNGTELSRYDKGIRTTNLGDVQRLPGGNTLVTFSTSAVIHEFDASGNTVLTIDMDGSAVGYSEWRETLYGSPYDIGL